MAHGSQLRQAWLVLVLGRVTERLGHDLALAEEESAGISPLASDLFQALVTHVAHTENPDVVMAVELGTKLVDERELGGLGVTNRSLCEGGDLCAL